MELVSTLQISLNTGKIALVQEESLQKSAGMSDIVRHK